jgi:hypothetical protein
MTPYPTDTHYPADWNHSSTFYRELMELLVEADCEWHQVCTDLSYALAVIVVAEEEDGLRTGMAKAIADLLVNAARTRVLPGRRTVQ